MLFTINGKKILFIHIPKTGGTSIEKFFLETMGENMFCDNKYRGSYLWGHKDNKFFQHLTMGEIFSEYKLLDISKIDFIFTISREPISRFKSYYKWYIGNDKKHILDHLKTKSNDSHVRPQTDYIKHFREKVKIYKYESGLQNIINDVLKLNNIKSKIKLSHTLNYKKKKTSFSKEEIKKIKDFYKDDFVNFTYLVN